MLTKALIYERYVVASLFEANNYYIYVYVSFLHKHPKHIRNIFSRMSSSLYGCYCQTLPQRLAARPSVLPLVDTEEVRRNRGMVSRRTNRRFVNMN